MQYDNDLSEIQSNEPVKKKRRGFLFKFFRLLFITLGVFVIVISVVVFGYTKMFGDNPISEAIAKELDSNLARDGSILDVFSGLPEHTNFAILGLDEGNTRTDVIMVGSYNSRTSTLDLISVPRDTYAVIPKERRDILKENGRSYPSTGEMKINAVHHYAGEELGTEFIVKQLEDIFDIKIGYYVKVDLQAFRDIVDELGGIEFDVPQRMYYQDPEQDLSIDLKPGLQVLSGAQAEGLVRYRKSDINNPISKGYAEGDLQRVRVQQDFLKALVSQLLTKEKLLSNSASIVSIASKYVTTNFPASDVMRYISSLENFDVSKINAYTVPSEIGSVGGTSYVIIDPVETRKLIDEIFYANDTDEKDVENAPTTDSFDKRIQVLNGGLVKGLAASTMERLEKLGYTIESIGDSDEPKQENTIIKVKNKGEGEDLLEHFEYAEIVIDKNIPSGLDIIIIVGTK